MSKHARLSPVEQKVHIRLFDLSLWYIGRSCLNTTGIHLTTMRNITSTFSHTFSPPSSSPSARANREDCALSFRCVNTPVSDSEDGNATLEENFSAIAFDLDEDGRFWGVREGLNEEGMVIVTVWEGHMGETKDDMKVSFYHGEMNFAPCNLLP